MVTLDQKLNMPKTGEKRFYNHTTVVLCKKPLLKTANIREMRRFWKSAILQRNENGHFGSEIKYAKKMRETIL